MTLLRPHALKKFNIIVLLSQMVSIKLILEDFFRGLTKENSPVFRIQRAKANIIYFFRNMILHRVTVMHEFEITLVPLEISLGAISFSS